MCIHLLRDVCETHTGKSEKSRRAAAGTGEGVDGNAAGW